MMWMVMPKRCADCGACGYAGCDGYAKALTAFDCAVPQLLEGLKEEDILMITADHGCDPATESTDHSREHTPVVMYGANVPNANLGTRETFADISATVLKWLEVKNTIGGEPMI